MSACEHLVGRVLIGQRTGREWQVLEKKGPSAEVTPGQFSVGYKVVDSEGQEAFCKASDIGMFARAEGNFLDNLQRAINAQAFERRVLDVCHGNNMDRVVTALDYGDMDAEYEGTRDRVFFLVFEMATGDLRRHVNKETAFDLVWSVNALHNFAVAVNQLHSGEVSHNDLKPANALVFNDEIQKVADLGRATSPHIPAEHDAYLCAGDRRFAAPEQLYPAEVGGGELTNVDRRRAGDLYALGSLSHFLLTARSVTPEVVQMLRPEHRPRNLSGGFQDSFGQALPFWRAAFDDVMEQLTKDMATQLDGPLESAIREIIQMVRELCEPDPMLRGHPQNRQPGQYRFGLERYISKLDKLRNQLLVRSRLSA